MSGLEVKKRISLRDIPEDLGEETANTIARIEEHHSVVGVLYIKGNVTRVCTVPEGMAQTLTSKLPGLNDGMRRALTEIDVLDDLVAYRIATMTNEILVAAGPDFTACVVHTQNASPFRHSIMKILTNLIKDFQDEWLVQTAVVINNVNPIIDRIMEDDSVEGVVMTNKEGSPILTNISSTRATTIGLTLHPFGSIAQAYIKELDPFDEVLVTRIHTKRVEIMLAPHPEFNIIVVQHGRRKLKDRKRKLDKA